MKNERTLQFEEGLVEYRSFCATAELPSDRSPNKIENTNEKEMAEG